MPEQSYTLSFFITWTPSRTGTGLCNRVAFISIPCQRYQSRVCFLTIGSKKLDLSTLSVSGFLVFSSLYQLYLNHFAVYSKLNLHVARQVRNFCFVNGQLLITLSAFRLKIASLIPSLEKPSGVVMSLGFLAPRAFSTWLRIRALIWKLFQRPGSSEPSKFHI